MAVEIGKARRAKDPAEELAGVVHTDSEGHHARVLDLRTRDGQLQVKLEIAEGRAGWFKMEAGDSLLLERRNRRRSASAAAGILSGRTNAAGRKTEGLNCRLTLERGPGNESVEIAALHRSGNTLRFVTSEPSSGSPVSHELLPGDSIRVAEVPKRGAESTGRSPSLGDAIRAQILARLAEENRQAPAPAPRQPAQAPFTGPVYRTRTPRGNYEARPESDRDVPESLWQELRGSARRSVIYALLFFLPLGWSGWRIYEAWQYCFNPPVPASSSGSGEFEDAEISRQIVREALPESVRGETAVTSGEVAAMAAVKPPERVLLAQSTSAAR